MGRRNDRRRVVRKRILQLEYLEDRLPMAAEILSEQFKAMQFTATGQLTQGQVRYQVPSPSGLYRDDYGASLNLTGTLTYSSPNFGFGSGTGSGQGAGIENCPPQWNRNEGYAYDYTAQYHFTEIGDTLKVQQITTSILNRDSRCTDPQPPGATHIDGQSSGELDVSTMPYKAVVSYVQASTGYSNSGTITLDITPTSPDPFDLAATAPSFVDGVATFGFTSSGRTMTAATRQTVVTTADLYYATGPTAADIVGEPLGSLPIYWNSAGATMRVTELPDPPVGVSHLVVVVDRGNVVGGEASEQNNTAAISLIGTSEVINHSFTARVTLVDDALGQLGGVAVNQVIEGSFVYDRETQTIGRILLDFPELPIYPSNSLTATATANQAQVKFQSTAGSQVIGATLVLDGSFPTQTVPRCLEGLDGQFILESEIGGSAVLRLETELESLVCSPSRPGISRQVTATEEEPRTINLPSFHLASGVTIDPARITITSSPIGGGISVNSATGMATYNPRLNFFGNDSFSYVAYDTYGEKLATSTVSLLVAEVPEPYQNPAGPLFVDKVDLIVTPLDAILIINELNANGARALPPPTGPIPAYWDVDGDNRISPLDALLVVNYLNAQVTGEPPVGAEGEPLLDGDDDLLTETPASDLASADEPEAAALAALALDRWWLLPQGPSAASATSDADAADEALCEAWWQAYK